MCPHEEPWLRSLYNLCAWSRLHKTWNRVFAFLRTHQDRGTAMSSFTRYLVAPLALTLALPLPVPMTSRADFHDAMRALWAQHVEWTRMYIISAAAAAPDKDATTQR